MATKSQLLSVAFVPEQAAAIGDEIETGIAAAGTTAATATDLTKEVNVVATATADTADGVQLPAARPGKKVRIINVSGAALAIWPAIGDAIESAAANAEAAQADDTHSLYYAIDDTTWYRFDG